MPSQRVKIVEGGKLVIPARFRREMRIGPGDTVIVDLDDGELRVRSLSSAIRRVQERVRELNPDGRILSEELDASALLCLVNGEAGSERVGAVLPSAVVSAVNLAEVAAKLGELGADAEACRVLLAPLHLAVVPFDEAADYATGALRATPRAQGLSLGDRACLALCASRGATALTADKAWATVGERVGVPVETLR